MLAAGLTLEFPSRPRISESAVLRAPQAGSGAGQASTHAAHTPIARRVVAKSLPAGARGVPPMRARSGWALVGARQGFGWGPAGIWLGPCGYR